MTREEAYKVIKELKKTIIIFDREKHEALEMAIEALQQEEHLVELEAKAVAIIKSERHGEWQEHFDSIHATFEMRCSLCDYRLYMPQTDQFLQTSFCPNCGAKMDGGKKCD